MSASRHEVQTMTTEEILQKPWEVYEVPYFHDEWEKYLKTLPRNMSLVHQLGSRSYFETFKYTPDGQKMNRMEELTVFGDFGTQLEEDLYAEAFAQVKSLCKKNPEEAYLHVRHDLEGAVEETWRNAPFREIVGHSLHKIPQSQLATDFTIVDGDIWHKRDYYEKIVDTMYNTE